MITHNLNELFAELERRMIDISIYGHAGKAENKWETPFYEVTVSLSFAVNSTSRGPRVMAEGTGASMHEALTSAYLQLMNVVDALEVRPAPAPVMPDDEIPF